MELMANCYRYITLSWCVVGYILESKKWKEKKKKESELMGKLRIYIFKKAKIRACGKKMAERAMRSL